MNVRRVVALATLQVLLVPADALADPGQLAWVDRFEGLGGTFDWVRDILAAGDGTTVFVTGSDAGAHADEDVVTRALDASSGAELWTSRYQTPGRDVAGVLAANDSILVNGLTSYEGSDGVIADWVILGYDPATGAELWTASRTGQAFEVLTSLALTPSGTVVAVGGRSIGGAYITEGWTVAAFDAETGAHTWAVTSRSGNHSGSLWGEAAYDVAITPDGALALVTGTVAGPNGHLRAAVVAFDAATGDEMWRVTHRAEKQHDAVAVGVAVAPDGATAFVTGFTEHRLGASSLGSDVLTLAVDVGAGTEAWSRTSGGSRGDESYDLEVSPDGSTVFIAGYERGSRMRTEALDATDGTRIWRSSFAGPDGQSAYAREIAMAPDGAAVYVTGWREGDDVGGADIATICYDAVTGAELWVATYAGPDSGYDFSTQLDVAPDGSMVFVGGSVDQGGTGEWALLAYEGA